MISYSTTCNTTAHVFYMYGPLSAWAQLQPSGQINSALQINLIILPLIWVPALHPPECQLLCSNRVPEGRVAKSPTCVRDWWNAFLQWDQGLQHHGQGCSTQTYAETNDFTSCRRHEMSIHLHYLKCRL